MMLNEFRTIYSIIKIVIKTLSVIFGIILIFEIVKLVSASWSISIYLGITVLVALIGMILGSLIKIKRLLGAFPVPLEVPNTKTARNAHEYLKQYSTYLITIATRLVENPNVSESRKEELTSRLELLSTLGVEETDAFREKLANFKINAIEPAILDLDESARLLVRNSVRDNMLGVIILPLRSLDSVFLLFRLFRLFIHLVYHYKQRPLLKEVWAIFRDVINLIVVSNVLSFSGKGLEKLVKKIPFLDGAADDIVQGIGVGLFTTAIGYSIIQRCNTIDIWEKEKQENLFKKASKEFPILVFQIFKDDIYHSMAQPVKNTWNKIRDFINDDMREKDSSSIWASLFKN